MNYKKITSKFYKVSQFGIKVLDLNDQEDIERVQTFTLRLEELVKRRYVFSIEELGNFSMNVDGFPHWISRSTYSKDGNMIVFTDAIKRLKQKVGLN